MTFWLRPDLPLLDEQCLLPLDTPFTPALAARLGVSERTLRTLVARGLVRRVSHGVYAAAQAPQTQQFRAAALALVVAPGAVVTDRTAAWLHGIDLMPRSRASVMPPLQVFSAQASRVRRVGVASGERTLAPGDATMIGDVAVTTPLRTACDLGRLLYRFDALAALDAFLRLGVRHEALLTEVGRFKHYRGIRQLRVLSPLADPRSESVAESWLRLFWYDAGLPEPEPQWWVCDDAGVPRFRFDLALPAVRFAAEYDGRAFHSSDEDRAHDDGRRTWLSTERDWYIVVFTDGDVFAPRADPGPRLREGLVVARRRLTLPTAYPRLAQPGGF